MEHSKFTILILAILFSVTFLSARSWAAPRLIPMEDFFRNPETAMFRLSPDGTRLAYLKPWERRMNVFVRTIGSDDELRLTAATERNIAGFFWASDSRIVFLQDNAGDENYHVFAVNTDGSNLKELTPFPGVRASIVDDLEDNPDEMLVGLNKRDNRVFDVYRLNIHTGEMSMIAENPGNITGWMTDHAGRLRVAMATDGVNTSLLYRETETEPFKTILTTNFRDSLNPLLFSFDDTRLFVASNLQRDKLAVYEYDPKSARLGKLIFENADVDVGGLLWSKKRKVLTGVSYVTDKVNISFFDDERKNLQKELEARLPDKEVSLVDRSRDETRWLVVTHGDRELGTYWFYDAREKRLEKLADLGPWLKENEMARMKPVEYTARDGLKIHGYLTLPLDTEPKNLPVVILPHGGPWARDSWGFDPEVQFLVNRGAAVLQMNFRGSTGYGKAFWQAGFKQWGRAMQDDITDGVRWLLAQGVADPKRIAIYGASYGGYAVLAGLAFTPDLYCCGVDYVGVSNIFTLLASIPPYWEPVREMFCEQVGDPEKDRDLLKSVSPLFSADRIKAPLLVAQGANDPRVKKAESDQIVEALRSRGIPVEYIVKDNEGHGFSNEENRFDFYRAMERFLGKTLGLRSAQQ